MQTPLSDDSGSDFAELLDTPAEEDSAGVFAEDELGTVFAELLKATVELELTFAELDEAELLSAELSAGSVEDDETAEIEDEDSSPTAAGEPSESPHAQNTSELAKTADGTKPKTNLRKFIKFQPRRSANDTHLIYIKKRSLEKLRHRY